MSFADCSGAPFLYIRSKGYAEDHQAFSALARVGRAGCGAAADGRDGCELRVHHRGQLPGKRGAVRRHGTGSQRLVLAGAAHRRKAGQGVCKPCHPHGAEAGHPVHGPPGLHPAGLVQLRPADHHRQRRQCGLRGHGSRLRRVPFPGKRRVQGRADRLAAAGNDDGRPVRGRQHRRAVPEPGAGKACKAHGLVPLFLPVHPAGQRRGGAFRRAGGAGRRGGPAHLWHGR